MHPRVRKGPTHGEPVAARGLASDETAQGAEPDGQTDCVGELTHASHHLPAKMGFLATLKRTSGKGDMVAMVEWMSRVKMQE